MAVLAAVVSEHPDELQVKNGVCRCIVCDVVIDATGHATQRHIDTTRHRNMKERLSQLRVDILFEFCASTMIIFCSLVLLIAVLVQLSPQLGNTHHSQRAFNLYACVLTMVFATLTCFVCLVCNLSPHLTLRSLPPHYDGPPGEPHNPENLNNFIELVPYVLRPFNDHVLCMECGVPIRPVRCLCVLHLFLRQDLPVETNSHRTITQARDRQRRRWRTVLVDVALAALGLLGGTYWVCAYLLDHCPLGTSYMEHQIHLFIVCSMHAFLLVGVGFFSYIFLFWWDYVDFSVDFWRSLF